MIRRTSPPDQDTSSAAARYGVAATEEEQEPVIDWVNLSAEDKQVFFSWLDEFFARYSGNAAPPRSASDTNISSAPPVSTRAPLSTSPPPPARGAPVSSYLKPWG